MTDTIRAPWSAEQVAALNRFQREGGMHPFTCGGEHTPGSPTLVAYTDGWRCPQPYGEACDYRQDWAHAFMAEPDEWPRPFAHLRPTPAPERKAKLEGPGADGGDLCPVDHCDPDHCGQHSDTGCTWRPAPAPQLRDQIAAAMREHYLSSSRDEADADGNMPCRCGDWREPGPMGSDEDDWDTHLADAVLADTAIQQLQAEVATARETNRRLNHRAQQLESELAAYRRAVGQWDVSERGTYIPLASLRTIGQAAGTDILGSPRHLAHFERVEQAEAALERVTAECDAMEQAMSAGHASLSRLRTHIARIRDALNPQEQP